MSHNVQNNLNAAILEFMKERGITHGGECPVLRVTLAGYSAKGEPLFSLRPATSEEFKKARTENIEGKGN